MMFLSPTCSSGTSRVFRIRVRVTSRPAAFRNTIFIFTRLSVKPRSERSLRAAMEKLFSSMVSALV